VEYLLGASAIEWVDWERVICISLTRGESVSRDKLVEFAEGFADDPVKMRER